MANVTEAEKKAIIAILNKIECYKQSELQTYRLAEAAITRCCGIELKEITRDAKDL